MNAGRAGPFAGAALAAAGALTAYLATLAPDLLPGDSGEFQFAVPTLGIVHPTGYPLYLLTGRALALLPLGGPALRVNLASALWAALAAGVTFLLSYRLLGVGRSGVRGPEAGARPHPGPLPLDDGTRMRPLAALGGALAFALSPTLWSQAVVAEVYALHALLFGLVLWLWLVPPGPWRSARRRALLGLALGLGLAHHRGILLVLPALALDGALVAVTGRRDDGMTGCIDQGGHQRPHARTFSHPGHVSTAHPNSRSPHPPLAVALVLIPLLLYAYLPLRMPGADYLRVDLGKGRTAAVYGEGLDGFIDLVTGRNFSEKIRPPADVGELARRLGDYGDVAGRDFGPVGLGLGVLGWVAFWRWDRRTWRNLTLIYTSVVAFGLLYTIGDVEVYFIPAHLVFAVWLAGGLAIAGRAVMASLFLWSRRAWRVGKGGVSMTTSTPPPRAGGTPALPEPWRAATGSRPDAGGARATGASEPGDHTAPRSFAITAAGPNRGKVKPARAGSRQAFIAGAMPILLVALVFAASPWRFERPERALAGATRARWDALTARLDRERAFLASDDRDELVPLYYAQRIEARARGVQPLFPNQAPAPAFANIVALIEAVAPDRPLYLAKPMPGLGVKFRLDAGDPPRVLGSGVATPPEFPLRETFGSSLALEGIDLPGAMARPRGALRFAAPGAAVETTLRWRARATPDRDYATFVQAVAPDGHGLAGSDTRPGAPFYPPSRWRPGEALADAHVLRVPDDAAPGVYALDAGVYDPADLRRLVTSAGADFAPVGWLVVPPPPAIGPRTLGAAFEGGIVLTGTDIAETLRRQASDRRPLAVDLFWRGEGTVEQAFTVFVHLVDADGRLVAQQDGEPLAGRYPTWAWAVDHDFRDPHAVPAGPLSPGTYRLVAGLYERESGRRLGRVGGGDSVELARVIVE